MAADKRPPVATTVAELVELLTQSGGELRVPDPARAERRRWRQTLWVASNEGGLPEGQRLRFKGRDYGDMVIWLVDDTLENQPRPSVLDLPAVPVPQTLRGLHPLLAATRDAVKRHPRGRVSTKGIDGVLHLDIAQGSLRRVLRLAQALASEAERRGGGLRPARCGVGLALRDHVVELVFTEENDRQPHVPTAAELRAQERASRPTPSGYVPYVPPMPKYDYYPSGRLVLRTGHGEYGTTTLANDRKRWTFENRLPLVFEKLEALTAKAERQQDEAERQAREREEAWQAAVEDARRQWAENCRHALLDDLLARRRQRLEVEALLAEFVPHICLKQARRQRRGCSGSPTTPRVSASPAAHSLRLRCRSRQLATYKNFLAAAGVSTVLSMGCRSPSAWDTHRHGVACPCRCSGSSLCELSAASQWRHGFLTPKACGGRRPRRS